MCVWPYLSGTQRACALLYCYLWPVWLYRIIQRHIINGKCFRKKLLNLKCGVPTSLQLLSETFLVLRRTERDMIKTFIVLHAKYPLFTRYLPVIYPLFLSDFNETWIFATDFGKVRKCQLWWKYVQWQSSCSMRLDREMDRQIKQANSRFLQYCERA